MDISVRLLHIARDFALTRRPDGEVNALIDRFLSQATMNRASLEDARSWLSVDDFERFAALYEEALGEHALSDAVAWGVQQKRGLSAATLTAFATPAWVYRHIAGPAKHFAHHLWFEVESVRSGEALIQLRFRPGLRNTASSCDVAIGALRGVPTLFGLPQAQVESLQCHAEGAPHSRYRVTWREHRAYGLWLGLVGLALGLLGHLTALPSIHWVLAPVVGLLVGRELTQLRLRRHMAAVTGEQREALIDDERDFRRRFLELERIKNSLQEQVSARTAELEVARDALLKENRHLLRALGEIQAMHEQSFVAALNGLIGQRVGELRHEINNPIHAITMGLEMLQKPEDLGGGEPAEIVEDLKVGLRQLQDVVLWFASSYEDEGEQQTCLALNNEVNKLVSLLQTGGLATRVQLDLQTAPRIHALGREPLQVVLNLIKNAAQADPTGEIEVRTRALDDHHRLLIVDHGPGMPPEVLTRIFDKGFTTKQGDGHGVGLHVTRAIVERHGARIEVRSRLGEGTEVQVDWPLGSGCPERSTSSDEYAAIQG